MRCRVRIATLACLFAAAMGCAGEVAVRSLDDPSPPHGPPIDPARTEARGAGEGLRVDGGFFVHGARAVWGYAVHNGWWGGFRGREGWWTAHTGGISIARRDPTAGDGADSVDLDRLTEDMVAYGYPGFEHNFGLGDDRRRDAHDDNRRKDANAVPPFLEQPWARSDEGTAWDGLPKYDLERYNPWYFERLREFAELCDRKGTLLLFSFYMQHALLEIEPHYVDFPWRPANAIQATGMPDKIPAANAFYDVDHPLRRRLHRSYIRKCLDELGGYSNVVFLPGQEFTGPLSFVEFWLDTVSEWERENGRTVLIGVGATKDVLDAVLSDPARSPSVSVIDLRYWFYQPDGTIHAPPGGREVPGRYAGGGKSRHAPAEMIYRQVSAYRRAFPDRAILHDIDADRGQTWAFFMAGGSLLVQRQGAPEPASYARDDVAEGGRPNATANVLPLYRFVASELSGILPSMRECPAVIRQSRGAWCLGHAEVGYLIYAPHGGPLLLDPGAAESLPDASWIDPRSGNAIEASPTSKTEGLVGFDCPDEQDWALWLRPPSPT